MKNRKEYQRRWYQENKERIRALHEKSRDKRIAYSQKWRKENKEKVKVERLFSFYGLSLETYNNLLKSQNGVCKICKSVDKNGRALAVDHKHVEGYTELLPEEKAKLIRGLLCTRCNQVLGLLQDKPELFYIAADYLVSNEK